MNIQIEDMADELTKKAVDMLLKGATLLREPCPYCGGVRVMKEGHALCVNCGKEPENRVTSKEPKKEGDILKILEKKLEDLSMELEKETDHKRQQKILQSINTLVETISNLKRKQ